MKLSDLFEVRRDLDNVTALIHSNMTDDEQLHVIRKSGQLLKNIIKAGNVPSEEVQLFAVRKKDNAINILLRNKIVPSHKVLLASVSRNPKNIIPILDAKIRPSEDVILQVIEDSINDRMGAGYVSILCSIPALSEKIVRKILDYNIFSASNLVESGNEIPSDLVLPILTNERFITVYSRNYDSFVKHHFKNNSLLMNKWLRYAENIREQS